MASTRSESRPALLDVNVLIALAWDSHVHHAAARTWFRDRLVAAWATCPITELGFVRVSCNRNVLPAPISIAEALEVLRALRAIRGHCFLTDDISPADSDVPMAEGHRQLTDAHLLTLARRNGAQLVTFDGGLSRLASDDEDIVLLSLLR